MKRERIVAWAESLTEEDLRHVVVNTVYQLIENEYLMFPENYTQPYWDSSGNFLIDKGE